jgi:hypothetical protein
LIENRSEKPPVNTTAGRWPRWLIASLLTGYAVVLAAVLWTETDTGTLEVRLNGAPVQVPVELGDKVLSEFSPITGTRVTLYSGEYRLGLRDPSGKFRIDTETFRIERGVKIIATVTRAPEPGSPDR